MIIREPENGSVRAWVLIRVEVPPGAEPPYDKAQSIYDVLGYKEGQDYDTWPVSMVVRADVVDHYYNIVIPVDAENSIALQHLVCEIQRITGATETAVLRVKAHYPAPPHAADGYLTNEEVGQYDDDGKAYQGRQRSSPGMNPWG